MHTGIKALLMCCACVAISAQAQDKRKMADSRIRFQNLQSCKDYTFYWRSDQGNYTHAFVADTSFLIPGNIKTPDVGYFWGINSITKKSTNSIEFKNDFSPDRVVIVNGVANDAIVFTQHDIANENTIGQQEKAEQANQKKEEPRQNSNTLFISIAAAAAASAITLFFIRRRKKRAA